MRILAIDTSCGAASVAAFEGATRETLASGVMPMRIGHAEALAPLVERVMAEVDGGFAFARRDRRDDRPRLVHRHPHRPGAGARVRRRARQAGDRRLDPGRLRRAAARRRAAGDHRLGDRRQARRRLPPELRSLRPAAVRAARRRAARGDPRRRRRPGAPRRRRDRDPGGRSAARRAGVRSPIPPPIPTSSRSRASRWPPTRRRTRRARSTSSRPTPSLPPAKRSPAATIERSGAMVFGFRLPFRRPRPSTIRPLRVDARRGLRRHPQDGLRPSVVGGRIRQPAGEPDDARLRRARSRQRPPARLRAVAARRRRSGDPHRRGRSGACAATASAAT